MVGQMLFYVQDLTRFAGRWIWLAAVLVLLGALLDGIGIVALIPLFSFVVEGDDGGTGGQVLGRLEIVGLTSPFALALAISAAFLLLVIQRGALQRWRDIYLRRLSQEYVDDWRDRMFTSMMAALWHAIFGQRRTDLELAITNDVSRLAAGNDRILRTSVQVAMVLVQLAILASLSLTMLAFAFGLFALVLLIGFPIIRQALGIGTEMTGKGRQIHRVLGNFLASQKLARLNNAQDLFALRFKQAKAAAREMQLRFVASQSTSRMMIQFVIALAISSILLVGYFGFDVPLAILLVIVVIVARIALTAQQTMQAAQSTANMLPALASLQETMASLTQDQAVPVRSGGVGQECGARVLQLLKRKTFGSHMSKANGYCRE